MKQTTVAALVVGGLILGTVGGITLTNVSTREPSVKLGGGGEFQAHGTFTLYSPSVEAAYDYVDAANCRGTNGFADVRDGTEVRVYDARGELLAAGQLESGAFVPFERCQLVFELPGVPRGRGMYQVEVGERGRVTYTQDQLSDGVDMTLGEHAYAR